MREDREAVTTVPHVDLDRYLGTWFEICRLPLRWEDATASDITATYSRGGTGAILVDNRCLDAGGAPRRALGEATPSDASNARLRVSFLPDYLRWVPFTKGDYWVLSLDAAYETALVGTPDRKHLWLLAREPEMDSREVNRMLDVARGQGFDLSALIHPRQSGRRVSDEMLGQ